jgi:diaminopimelate epimerase
MLLRNHPDYDFEMVYYNSDGYESTMCGNGGRCIVAFAHRLGVIAGETEFIAVDGPHQASLLDEEYVSLKMIDVDDVEQGEGFYFLNTGSPHYVCFVDNLDEIDIIPEAHKIRYSDRFKREGTNVNFIELNQNELKVRTYERGVENETLACGTGVTACAIATALKEGKLRKKYPVSVKGGKLAVKLEFMEKQSFSGIWLEGPANYVFKGEWPL